MSCPAAATSSAPHPASYSDRAAGGLSCLLHSALCLPHAALCQLARSPTPPSSDELAAAVEPGCMVVEAPSGFKKFCCHIWELVFLIIGIISCISDCIMIFV